MMRDVGTIIWKEWKEFFLLEGQKRSLMRLVIIGAVGIILAVRMGGQFGASWITLFPTLLMAVTVVMSVVADSFAGERERHTLETLLATRLSDRAILFGKVLATLSYGMAMAIIVLGAGLVTAYVRPGAHPFGPDPVIIGASLLGSFLLALLFTSIGILLSLRAKTVRQAQQGIAIVFMIVYFAPLVAVQLVSAGQRARVARAIAALGPRGSMLALAGAVLALDLLLLAIALARFRRPKLVLA